MLTCFPSKRYITPSRKDHNVGIRKRLLIVEPEEHLHQLIRMYLGTAYEAIFITTRQQALQVLSRQHYDVLLSNLAPQAGFQAFAQMARQLRPNIKVVLLSAHPNAGQTPNIDAFVEKGFESAKALPTVIAKLLANT